MSSKADDWTHFNDTLKPSVTSIWWILGAPYIPLLALYIFIIATFNFSFSISRPYITFLLELGLCAITIKKYKPHSSKKVIEGLENVLKMDFTTTSINEK